MTDGGVYGTADGLGNAGAIVVGVGASVFAGILAMGAATASAAEPSGAGPVVGLIVGGIVALNLRNPMPFYEAEGKWQQLADKWASFEAPLKDLVNQVGDVWKGDSADAFVNFMNRKVVSMNLGMTLAATAAAGACLEMASILTLGGVTFLVTTASTIVALLAANGTGPFSPGVKWAIVGTWVGIIGALLTALIPMIMASVMAVQTAEGGHRTLVRYFGEATDQVAAGSKNLNAVDATKLPTTADVSDPTGWEKE